MDCKSWNDEWVAQLYGELDGSEASRMERHLAHCAACRRTLEQLEESRRLLQEATPPVPVAPRVLVLSRPGWRRPVWSFAVGLACASILFVAGWAAATRLTPGASMRPLPIATNAPTASGSQAPPSREELQRVWTAHRSLEQQLARFEQALPQPAAGQPRPAVVTRPQLESELSRLQHQLEVNQARSTQFLLEELGATELRTGRWIDETWQALQVVALRGDPRVNER